MEGKKHGKDIFGEILLKEGILSSSELEKARSRGKTAPPAPQPKPAQSAANLTKSRFLLGEILLQEGVVSEKQLAQALEKQKTTPEKRVGQILVELGAASKNDIVGALGLQLGVPVFSLKRHSTDARALEKAPKKFWRDNGLIPVSFQDGLLQVAMVDPLDLYTTDILRETFGCDVETMVCTDECIDAALKKAGKAAGDTVERAIADLHEFDVEIVSDADMETAAEGAEEELVNEAPIIKLVNLIILDAVKKRATDIHVEPFANTLKIRYRVDGTLYDTPAPNKKFQAAIISRLKLMANLNIAEKRLPQDGSIRLRVMEHEIDIRVSSLPTVHGESVVMRLLDKKGLKVNLQDIGMSAEMMERWKKLIALPNGILLVTGPTGSGKTTTLYSSLSRINQPDRKIITIEDPVEYQLDGINQIPVKPGIGLTFAAGLRSILRQDPNVIMVGEIRDVETARIAIQASLTGHLVFSTLHTNDAASSITRLIDMGVEAFLVTSSLAGVAAQRLVRTLCVRCKKPRPLTDVQRSMMSCVENLPADAVGYEPEGCAACGQTGYQGQTAIFELFEMNDALRHMTLESKSAMELKRAARRHGMLTLLEDGFRKVLEGATSYDEALRVANQDADDAAGAA